MNLADYIAAHAPVTNLPALLTQAKARKKKPQTQE